MSAYFVDTSAIAKRYIPETGSAWLKSWVEPHMGNDIILSALALVEFTSLCNRREREGLISSRDSKVFQEDFLLHVEAEYIVIALDDPTLIQARELLPHHLLRSLDALQLACALRAARVFSAPLTFISADVRLLEAAAAEGLPVDNPNDHP